MSKSRISRFLPGAPSGGTRGLGLLSSVFFYLCLAVVVFRADALWRLLRSPVRTHEAAGIAALAGLALFYGAAVIPASIERRAPAGVFAVRCRRFWRNKPAVAGLAVLMCFVSVALFAPLVTPSDPVAHADPAAERYRPPSFSHPMGTDKFGRDVYTRVVFGARLSLSVAILVVVVASFVGTLVGAYSGYSGGRADDVAMRFVDGLLAFPRLLLLLTLVAFFSNSLWVVVLLLAATGWMGVARLVRADVVSLKEREFVQAAVASGLGRGRIVWRHLIPNAIGTVLVAGTLRFAVVILLEAYLSFLGLGVQPPTPSWGSMVFEGREVLLQAWWVSAFPGAAIAAAVVSCNLVGDGLAEALDARAP